MRRSCSRAEQLKRSAGDRADQSSAVGVVSEHGFGGPGQVLKYLARYTHRVAVSNDRLVDIYGGQVRFTYKDYRAHPPQRPKTMTLAAAEFIRRFLLHVPPAGLFGDSGDAGL